MESMIGTAFGGVKEFFSKEKFFSKEDLAKLYERDLPSFSSRLPYGGYCEDTGTFILEDLCSRAVCLTLEPIPTEGRSSDYLVRLRDAIEDMYDVFDPKSDSDGQWVIQEFSYDDASVDALMEKMEQAIEPHARGTKFTNEYLKMMRHHLTGLSEAPNGLFHDKEVTGEQWRLKVPRTKMVLYRRVSSSENKLAAQGKFDPAREVNQVVEEIKVKLGQAGVKVVRDEFQGVFEWLYKLFNPSPDILEFSSKDEYYSKVTQVEPELIGGAMSEALLGDFPESSIEDNCWYFNGKPMRFLRFAGLKKSPRIGQLTGEVVNGEGNSAITRCLTDSLPVGCIVAKTVVITTQSEFDMRMSKIANAAKSNTPTAETARNNIEATRAYGGNRKKVLCSMGVYVSAEDLSDLEDKQRKVLTVMNNNGITLFKDDVDGLSLDSFLIHLPMNFRPDLDPKRHYLRSMYAQHAANLSLAFGRSEGSGVPCLFAFNRGGSPLMFDPFNMDEKANNSFGFIVGGPGAGKSVKICTDAYSIMAFKRPRLFIVEYGNSFGLAAKDWRAKGLTVNEMVLSNKKCPSLAPFATIDKVLGVPEDKIALKEGEDDDAEEEDDIDYLGELELLAMLMITGSEAREEARYNLGDKSLLRRALVETAQRNRDLGAKEGGGPRPTITQDIIDTLRMMANGDDENISDGQASKLLEMAQSLERYTTGFNGKLFNRPGEDWPDADITLINLATLSSDNNRDKLNVAYTSLSQYINNLAERTQNDPRDIVMYTDEAHLLLNNDQLAKLIVKQVKTARKLGVWPQLCTQNVQDCSGGAEKLLSMIEWYYCLNTGIAEARHVKRYKNLSDEQVKLITSTRKQARAYTEGVVLSDKAEYQFRSVPPSLILAVSMTESSEKAERTSILKERGLRNELEAAYAVAANLDKARGIKGELKYDDLVKGDEEVAYV
ncbi:conjugative transfer ATPase [Vibrio owensii]|uniref:conjugative transfer ATPase n=1 Tax=Vibrio owensii TaxID=696485 RepID=UPI0018F1F747|nr:conjugative transfer ATPase [Vibrio owensii]